jgi:2-keto-4-pentenoate hydratase/2-oxohepta-3-ene-1,7-dioic acid hydratase in catechol pathway
MKLASLYLDETEQLAIYSPEGLLPLSLCNSRFDLDWPEDLLSLIKSGRLSELGDWFNAGRDGMLESLHENLMPAANAAFAPLYRRPRKIWGIGLNYREHAADLSETAPETEPASFLKPDTTIIGHGDTINIPLQSDRTTGEAELGIIIGKECKDVEQADWLDVVAGFTTVIDMTAEDILRKNTRYLTRSKSFDTFFSFGPLFLTVNEISNIGSLEVSTVINDKVHAHNLVSNMTFPADFLVSFHSKVMTLLPGDIISTGTPGAALLKDGDRIECRIEGFLPLVNPVRDLKRG